MGELKRVRGSRGELKKANCVKHEQLAERVFMTHRAVLIDYAVRIVGDKTQAEDIVQDAWLLSTRMDTAAIREPLGYLRRTVRNLAIDLLRRKAREARISGGDLDAAIRTVEDPQASPEATLSSRRDLACVLRVLRGLPDRQRIAIEMHRFGQFKLREIADRLNISIALVHLAISDGLATCADRCGLDRCAS